MRDSWGSSEFQQALEAGARRRRNRWIFTGVTFAVLAAAGGAYYLFVHTAPRALPIEVAVTTPSLLKGGAVEVAVTVRNGSSRGETASGGELVVELPPRTTAAVLEHGAASSTSERPVLFVDDLGAGESVTRKFSLSTELDPGTAAPLRATYTYRTDRGERRFASARDVSFVVTQPAVSLSLEVPRSVVRHDPFAAAVRYRNNDAKALAGASLQLALPRGVTVVSATPAASATGTWQLGALQPGGAGEIQLRLLAGRDATTPLGVRASVLGEGRPVAEQSAALAIANEPLSVSVTGNGSAEPAVALGQQVSFVVQVANTSGVALKDVVVTAEMGNELYDLSTVIVRGGTLSPSKPAITWTGVGNAELRSLEPGAQVTLPFSVKLVESKSGSALAGPVAVTATSPTVPAGTAASNSTASATATAKVAANVSFVTGAHWRDPLGQIATSGPHPPQVGVTTRYVIRWELASRSAGLEDIAVTTQLPAGVTFTGIRAGASATSLTYDERTGTVTWKPGDVAANSTSRAGFQVAITPAANQAGREVRLTGDTAVEARDAFTGLEVRGTNTFLTTHLAPGTQGAGRGLVGE